MNSELRYTQLGKFAVVVGPASHMRRNYRMKFYNLKTRSHVDVPEDKVKKMKMVRKTKSGEQTRYAFTAEFEGAKLFKFVNEKDYKASKAPEA